MSTTEEQPSEEELRAAYEEQLKRIRVEHVLLENVATLINLGMRRTGLAPGTEDERDAGQVRLAVEAVRALAPVLEQSAPDQVGAIRDALSQLQLAFVRIGGGGAPAGAPATAPAGGTTATGGDGPPGAPVAADATQPEPERPRPGEPGPAQRSGRLWVPGQ
jgi:hypothetical protein